MHFRKCCMLHVAPSTVVYIVCLLLPRISLYFARKLRKARNRANGAENRPLSTAEIWRCARKAVPLHYVVKLLELCRQTPRKVSSNYSQYRNKKNRAKNNETFLQQIRTSNDGWCLL